ncbi:MAG: polyprenyl synthetase family protein [Planctomycetota bacterium]
MTDNTGRFDGGLGTAPAASVFTGLYAPIREDMNALNEFLRAEFDSADPFLLELLGHVSQFRGKQIRPACLFLAARWLGDVGPDHVRTAAAVELIHTATLVHDDLLDDARIRRRVETVNRRWGERTAVLLGDFLYSRGFTIAAEVPGVMQSLASVTHTVCRGELLQVGTSFDLALTEERYYEIIRQKTAVLYGLACSLGAMLSGASSADQQACGDFGDWLGMAFQIADDALDLVGDAQIVGKSLGTDLKKGKLTLPLIRLRETLHTGKLEEYMWLLRHPNEVGTHQRVLQMLREYDVLAGVRASAAEYVDRAIAVLDRLPASPLREHLEQLARYVVVRQA